MNRFPENRESGETYINGGGGYESFPLLLFFFFYPASLNLKPSIYISSISLLNIYCSCHNTKNKVCRFPTCFSRQFILIRQSIIFNSERRMPTRRRSACCPANACVVNRLSLNMLTEMDHLAAAGIEVTVTEEPCSRVRLSVKVHPAVIEECYTTVLTVFASVTKVPGFRQKVPTKRLINHVGESSFWWHINDAILKWTFPHAMSSLTERALKESACIIPKSSAIDETSFRHDDYFRYEVVVDVVPVVKWNPENGYKNLKVIVEVDTDINAQMACEAEIKRLHKALGSKTVVTDRGLQAGDMAVLELSTRKADNDEYVETIPPADSKDFQLDSEETDNFPPGFLHSIMGIQKGERKSFSLVYPESWRQESLQGVEVKFVVECKELFCRDLPLLNDSLAERLLPGCNTLCQVRKSILERFKFSEAVHKELAMVEAIFDQLCKMVEVDIPQFLFEQQGMRLFAFGLALVQENLEPNEEQLKSMLSHEALKKYLEKAREHITNLVKLKLAVEDIIRRENLQISALDEFVPSNMQDYVLDLMKDEVTDSVKDTIQMKAVIDFLWKHASVQYVSKGQRETP